MRILAAPDKFRGTATAAEVADTLPIAVRGKGAMEALVNPPKLLW